MALAQIAQEYECGKAEREFFDLFIGIGRGELLPYGSYYLTGFLNERPLARLREDLRALRIERAQGQLEPEDHAAILCEIMAGLVERAFCDDPRRAAAVFRETCIALDWSLFRRSGAAEAGDFYRCVGTVGRTFMEIEDAAFRLPRAVAKEGEGGDASDWQVRDSDGVSSFELLVRERSRPRRLRSSPAAKADNETNDEKRKSRYRESDHVKTFYRVNRYPS